MLDPARATVDVFPAFREYAHELEEAMRDAGDERYLNDVAVVELLAQAGGRGLCGVQGGFGAADAACEDDGVVDQGVALPG